VSIYNYKCLREGGNWCNWFCLCKSSSALQNPHILGEHEYSSWRK